MVHETDHASAGGDSMEGGIADEPELECLARLSNLVARTFRVPVAYLALLGPDMKVSNRLGIGREMWGNLRTYPLSSALAAPVQWPDGAGGPVAGFVPGKLRFAAAAPLRSSDGLELGLLVIADTEPHPEFTSGDLSTLTELASVLAGKMELRMLLGQAREARQHANEAEMRVRTMLRHAPVMIISGGVDGDAVFVNNAWLEFTGRALEDELGPGYADSFHPDHRERVAETYWDAFAARKPCTIRFPMLRHDGEYRLIEAHGAPRFRADGTFEGFVGCFIQLGAWSDPEFSAEPTA
jgi:PAS domain S-box-containing protein